MAKQVTTTAETTLAPAYINLLLRADGASPEELKAAMNRVWVPRAATIEAIAADYGYRAKRVDSEAGTRFVFAPTKKAIAPAPMPVRKAKAAAPMTAAAPKAAKPAARKAPAKAATTRVAPQRWADMEEAAKRGVLPTPPDFSAATHTRYRPKLDILIALVKAKDLKGLKAVDINPTSTSPKAMDRYRNAAVIALKAKAAR
jgi:hypothetical protein